MSLSKNTVLEMFELLEDADEEGIILDEIIERTDKKDSIYYQYTQGKDRKTPGVCFAVDICGNERATIWWYLSHREFFKNALPGHGEWSRYELDSLASQLEKAAKRVRETEPVEPANPTQQKPNE